MNALNWALMTLSGNCTMEMAVAGLDFAKTPVDLDNFESEMTVNEPEHFPHGQTSYPIPDSEIEDDGSPVLKLFYESLR